MPRKHGLGRDMEKTVEALDALIDGLKGFSHKCSGSMKKHIGATIEDRDNIIKAIDETSEDAHKLSNKIENLKRHISEVKNVKSSRFAKKVVANFLGSDEA